jgi:hypothetical protein
MDEPVDLGLGGVATLEIRKVGADPFRANPTTRRIDWCQLAMPIGPLQPTTVGIVYPAIGSFGISRPRTLFLLEQIAWDECGFPQPPVHLRPFDEWLATPVWILMKVSVHRPLVLFRSFKITSSK